MNPLFLPGGSLQSAMRTMKLEMQWQQRTQNMQQKKQKISDDPEIARKQREVERLQEQAADARKGNLIAGMDAKLKTGQSLSQEEMDYLKVHNPQLYQEAVQIRQEREQYKRELENCRTQEDVEKLKARKLQGFLSQSKTIMQNPNIPKGKKQELMDKILRRLMMVEQEQRTFVASDRYQTLPKDQKELRGESDGDEASTKPPEEAQKPDAPTEGKDGDESPETPGKGSGVADSGKPAGTDTPGSGKGKPSKGDAPDPAVEIRRMAASLGIDEARPRLRKKA